jgi:hypothetical protein
VAQKVKMGVQWALKNGQKPQEFFLFMARMGSSERCVEDVCVPP